MIMSPKNFFLIFSKNIAFFEKIVKWKKFKISFPIKKAMFIFVAKRLFLYKRDLAPKQFFVIFSENYNFFWKKLLNNKIFNTSFVIKNSYANFWGKTPPFSKKLSNVSPKKFFTVVSGNTAFFEKLLNKKIFTI